MHAFGRCVAVAHWMQVGRSVRMRIACECLVGLSVAEVFEFVAQGAGPQVRVFGQTGTDVGDEWLERIDLGGAADAGFSGAVEVVADGAAVAAQMSGDRRDRPPLLP